MKYGIVIVESDGNVKKEIVNSDKLRLKYLQEKVGGYIQIVGAHLFDDITDDIMLVLDDEGKLKEKPFNAIATALYGNRNDCIVGDVVVCTTFSSVHENEDVYPFEEERIEGVFNVILDLKKFLSENGIAL